MTEQSMMQQTLFGDSIQERFERFHVEHPEVMRELVARARLIRSRGFTKYSIRTLWEIVRWHFQIERGPDDDFKLNDHFHSRYARRLMEEYPDLAGMFETRELKA